MLGVRLEPKLEREFGNYAREIGRSKSAIVRDLIATHLESLSVDEQMRRAARHLAKHDNQDDYIDFDWTEHG
jgi:predicted DNA-binding protein